MIKLKIAYVLDDSITVKNTIVDDVAVQIAGCTPIASIKGTVIIPPPTMNTKSYNQQKAVSGIIKKRPIPKTKKPSSVNVCPLIGSKKRRWVSRPSTPRVSRPEAPDQYAPPNDLLAIESVKFSLLCCHPHAFPRA